MGRAAQVLADVGYGAGWSLVKALPDGLADRTFGSAAELAFRRRGPRTIQLARNLHRVLGDQSTPAALAAVTRAGLQSYSRYWRETFRLPGMDKVAVAEKVLTDFHGMEHIQAAQDAGRGMVLALPHSGNWDIGGLGLSHVFGGIVTVAERLKPESLYDKFLAYRESLGFEVLPLTGGAVSPSQVLKERLLEGKLICLMADRDLSSGGVAVDFFGEQTKMPAGPAMLAALTGADFCPAHLAYTDDGWLTEIGAPLALPGNRLRDQVRGGTQLMADFFASRIAEHPADWHMVQPLWLADLHPDHPGRRSAKK